MAKKSTRAGWSLKYDRELIVLENAFAESYRGDVRSTDNDHPQASSAIGAFDQGAQKNLTIPVKRVEAGNVVHNHFGRANPPFETKEGQLWIEVDFIVSRDMHDCFLANEAVTA
jgi:hypothetical protein